MDNDELIYIRNTYNVPAEDGMRVFSKYSNRYGTIVGALNSRLRIILDGDDTHELYHPTWELEYITDGKKESGKHS